MVIVMDLTCITPLFVPGDRPELFKKAVASMTDTIILDLEDAVTNEAKSRARDAVSHIKYAEEPPLYVRINGRGTPWFEDDLTTVASLPWMGIVLPKSESITDIEAVRHVTGTDRPLIILVESALGIANARSIAAADTNIRLAFGSVDYCADVGCTPAREALLLARSELVLASRLGGLAAPLDGVTLELTDTAVIEDDARYAAELGFGGKFCVHPGQIAPVREGFIPGDEELAWARKVLALDNGTGAVMMDGKLVDTAVQRRASGIIARHRQLTVMSGEKNQE